MNDDDRRLADRLRSYESGVPVSGDSPVLVRPRRVPWAALAGVAAVLVLAVVLASGLLRNEPAVGEASPTPSVSTAESTAPSADERRRTPITGVAVENEGRTLVVEFLGSACLEDYAADVARSAEAIEVTVYGTPRPIPSGHACALALTTLSLDIALDPPFTGSEVRDGYTGETFSVGVASATATPAPATPAPTPGAIVHWAQVGVFSSEGWATEVVDMTYAAGQFIAIGYREPDDQRGHVGPPIDEPLIWISTDGRTWEQIEPGPAFVDGHPRSIVALPDGSAVAYGTVDPDPPAGPTSAAWRTTDGRTWTSLALTLPRTDFLTDVVSGPHGLLSVMNVTHSETRDTTEIWHSENGASWRVVHTIEPRDGFVPLAWDWEAGPEGFVVTGMWFPSDREVDDDRPFAFASGDGVSWFEATAEATPTLIYGPKVAPVGGDWMVVGERSTESVSLTAATAEAWYSSNGLAWERRGSFDIPLPSNPRGWDIGTFVGRVVSTGERVVTSGFTSVCCHGPAWAAGVWSSFDGRSWERLGFPEGTVVSAAAQHDGIVVLAGFDRARPEDEFKARAVFWIGERR